MSKEVATQAIGGASVPAFLQTESKARLGNIDRSDLIIPRIKLLQAISPEVTEFDNAKQGVFWHTVAGEPLGNSLLGIPILMRKTYVLWSPRNDDRGILARADDGLHWDHPAGTKFTVRPKGSPHDIAYILGGTVHERVDGHPALSEFGSSVPGDPQSPPAAALTYQFLWFFPDFPDMSPAIIINTRSSVKHGKDLISKIDMKPVDPYGQLYRIGIKQEQGDEGPFYNYVYSGEGYVQDQGLYERCKAIYDTFSDKEWRANDEGSEDKGEGGETRTSKSPTGPSDSSKF